MTSGWISPVAVEKAGGGAGLFCTCGAAEDPTNRRLHAGGAAHHTLHLTPMCWPDIVSTPNGPAIFHASEDTLVTTSEPAKSGEILTLLATGLGTTHPSLRRGQVFAASPLRAVSSPVEVLVNGKPAKVLYAGSRVRTADRYEIDFRVPDGTAPGMASVQMSAAWIAGGARHGMGNQPRRCSQ